MRNRRLIRIVAIVLAALLVGGVVFGALISALAEAPAQPGNEYALTMEYLADEQALHITQRLIYVNPAETRLEGVVFYAAGNMFRRESAIMYENDDLDAVFPAGYAPAGIDLRSVACDGEPAEYGFQGEEELYLRVACDLEPGARCEFEFDYYLLLMACDAFQGVGELGVRLSAFYFAPAAYDELYGEFKLKKPLPFTRWLETAAADFTVALTLPEGWLPGGTGEYAAEPARDGRVTWRMAVKDVREVAVAFGRRYRVYEGESGAGTSVQLLTSARGAGRKALEAAVRAVEQCEAWFGPLPTGTLTLVETDYPLDALTFPGTIWLPTGLLNGGGDALALRLGCRVAQQYFGLAAWVEPSADAWLSDSLCEYVSYLLLEATEGHDSFLAAVNRDWVSALQQTVPGGLRVSSDATLFDGREYDVVVRRRGAVAFHELREAAGLEGLLAGLRTFYGMGLDGHTLTEMELVAAMDAATGKSWEAFLTDWVFNVGKYVNQTMVWFE